MSRRTPLGRVLGLGSAKEGTAHWWSQRVSAAALMPLGLWFVFSLAALSAGGDLTHAAVTGWLDSPVNTVLALLLVLTLCYHSQLGTQVIVEDYVHGEGLKIVSLLGLKFAHAVLAMAGVYAVLAIAFGGTS